MECNKEKKGTALYPILEKINLHEVYGKYTWEDRLMVKLLSSPVYFSCFETC